jgi:DNA polymerase I
VAKKKLFLVDGSNHAFRVQFALPPQHASDGFPTRVLYGFTLLFQKMMRTYRPDYCAVSFDSGKTFRHERYDQYKAHRSEMPADMRRQWGHLPELVEAFGYPCVMRAGFEADDVLGTLAKRFASDEVDVYIVTSDLDFAQLVNDRIFLVDDMKGRILKEPEVVAKLQVRPDQVIEMKGLAGDSSDNIPGVPGIGPKTASKLLATYGTLEAVLEAAVEGKIKGKRGEKLREKADDARLSAELATIVTDIDLGLELEDLLPRGVQVDPLRTYFDQWEFGMVARKMLPPVNAVDMSIRRAVRTQAEVDEVIASIRRSGKVGVGLRTTTDNPETASLIAVNFAWQDNVVYMPLEWQAEVTYDTQQARQAVFELLADPTVEKVGHDLKFVLRVLRHHEADLKGIGGDTQLLDYVLVAHRRTHGLEQIAQRHLGHTLNLAPPQEPLRLDDTLSYAPEAAHVAWICHDRLRARLGEGTAFVYDKIERPLMPILCDMEDAGIRLDTERLGEVMTDIAGRVSESEQHCWELAGRPFKVGSPREVAVVLFDELGLPALKKTKTGFSTASDVLEKLSDHHDLPLAILHWRQLSKLLSTYLKTLPSHVAADGRIHTTFNQARAATGRLSSENPNLQNIPVRTFEGRRIRECFVPAEGCVFLSADYSQVELRVLAHFCGDGPLVESFTNGEDIHRRTASEVWQVPIEAVTAEQRSAAKAINFGLLYGMSAFRLGRNLSISLEQAQQYMDDYFGRMPQVQAWIEATKAQCRVDGFVETLFGRRRLIPEIYAKSFTDRSAGEREAVNTRVQGTAADLIKIAMIRVAHALEPYRARILLQVHDELLLEVPEDELADVRECVVREMTHAAELKVPLSVNVATGANWNEAHG